MNPVQSRRLAQEAGDTYQRALAGGLFYLVAWVVLGFYGDAFERTPLVSWLLAFAFVGLAIARVVHRPVPDADDGSCLRWLRAHWGIVVVTTALWGGVFCWILLEPGFGGVRTAALFGTAGFANAVAHAFNMRRRFALASTGTLYLPGLLVLSSDPADHVIALVMSIYLVYVLIALVRSHAEYQQRLDLEQELRSQRDLFAQQSRIDPLTELANRRHFSDVLANAATHALRSGEPLTLLVLDIDHFKKINDTYGHTVGDACLVAIAGRLRSAFNDRRDLIARLGGEEFGIVLAGQSLPMAANRAERFREDLARHPIALVGPALAMTASIGIAEFDRTMRDVDELYCAADRAVYRAKAAGRNRVCRDEGMRERGRLEPT